MSHPAAPPPPSPSDDPSALSCVERTRSAVLNVMVVEGAAIALSGWVLGRLEQGALPVDRTQAWRVSIAGLFAILLSSRIVLRMAAGRSALRDPARRARRFFQAHVASASLGALAVPLGFAYGWGVEPSLQAIAPFWVVALGVGFLALPRLAELEGFDEPIHQELAADPIPASVPVPIPDPDLASASSPADPAETEVRA